MTFENATLADVSARLSEALKLKLSLATTDAGFQTITADFSHLTLQEALKSLVDQAGSKRVEWRITISDLDGVKAPTIAIMIGTGAAKKKVPRGR
jgi:hypothetical protein